MTDSIQSVAVRAFYDALDARWPLSLACPWDHDGLAVCDKVVALGSDGIVRTSKTDLKETVKTIFKDKQNDNQI